SFYNGNIHIKHVSSAIIIKIKSKIYALLPYHDLKADLLPTISDFNDEIGSGKKIEVKVLFSNYYSDLLLKHPFDHLSDNINDFESDPNFKRLPHHGDLLQIPCIWEFKFYNSIKSPNLVSQSEPYLSVQIQIAFIPENIYSVSLVGYAPIYMKNSGHLNLNSNKKQSAIDPKNITFFSNGWQSWSISYLLGYHDKWKASPVKLGRTNLENQDPSLGGRYQSEFHTVISDLTSKSSLAIGFITLKDQFSRILMDRLKSGGKVSWLCAYSQTDGIKFQKLNEGLKVSEICMISLVKSPEAFESIAEICRFGGILAKSNISEKILTGWCSWYYYYTKVSENDIIRNLEYFKRHPDLAVDLIQLDDGYQTYIGDWGLDGVFNSKFPHELKWLVKKIHNSNFKAGLWVAPFFIAKNSKFWNEHSDWALKTKSGHLLNTCSNWGHSNYGLDLSRDDVLKYINNLSSTITRDWGFDFLKIDFIYSSEFYNANYSNSALSRAQILRKGVQAVRDGMGPEKMLLGCGAPLGPCVGLVDVMRIGMDSKEVWSNMEFLFEKIVKVGQASLKLALKSTLQRSYMHNTWWINDPDCALVRENRSKLTLNEILLQLTIFGLSGGQILISDDETKVSDERQVLLKKIIPPFPPQISESENLLKNFGAIPLDMFTRDYPSIYARTVQTPFGIRHLAMIANWEKNSVERAVNLQDLISWQHSQQYKDEHEFLIFDFWNEKLLGKYRLGDNLKNIEIAPHGCRYLSIVPIPSSKDHINESDILPVFISSTLHICQGAREFDSIEKTLKKIQISLQLPGERAGDLFFFAQKDMDIKSTTHSVKSFPALEGNLLKIHVCLKNKANVVLLVKSIN
ncbi:MAG: glycoside hydrolase family 36 protein, partial [Promethearchaeota archaeon]